MMGFNCGEVATTWDRTEALGTKLVCVELNLCSNPSKLAKKKLVSFLIGPPTLPPNWFSRNGGTFDGSNGERVSSALFRKNSKTSPCNRLVPDFVTTLICAPPMSPYSAV